MRQTQKKATREADILREENTRATVVMTRVRRSLAALGVVYWVPLCSFNGTADTTKENERKTMQHRRTQVDMMLVGRMSEAEAALLVRCIARVSWVEID